MVPYHGCVWAGMYLCTTVRTYPSTNGYLHTTPWYTRPGTISHLISQKQIQIPKVVDFCVVCIWIKI